MNAICRLLEYDFKVIVLDLVQEIKKKYSDIRIFDTGSAASVFYPGV